MIYLTHGALDDWSPERISHALFIPAFSLATSLKDKLESYVSLDQALAGRGDALTIDDATFAGFEAAMLARKYGHAVSWFVNGANVTGGLPYFPYQLSWMLDETRQTSCYFDGREWALRTLSHRQALRLRLKQIYMDMTDQREVESFVQAVSHLLDVEADNMEQALKTVTSTELSMARVAGIDIQSHGWNHLNPQAMSRSQVVAEIKSNEEYLAPFRTTRLRAYAPPFGKAPSLATDPGLATEMIDCVMLCDRSLIPGRQSENIVNRTGFFSSSERLVPSNVSSLETQ